MDQKPVLWDATISFLLLLQVVTVTARFGNVRKELGVFFMNSATSMTKGYGNPTDMEQVLWKRSFE